MAGTNDPIHIVEHSTDSEGAHVITEQTGNHVETYTQADVQADLNKGAEVEYQQQHGGGAEQH